MDGMYWLMLTSRVLHILGAIVLVGSIFYQRMVVAPAAPADSTTADDWLAGRRAAWARWIGIATLVLLVTGVFNFIRIVQTNQPLGGAYHAVFGIKFVLAMLVFSLAAVLAGRSPASDSLRQEMRRWLSMCLAIGIVTVVLGGVLRSLPHVPAGGSVGAPLLIQPSTGQPPEQTLTERRGNGQEG